MIRCTKKNYLNTELDEEFIEITQRTLIVFVRKQNILKSRGFLIMGLMIICWSVNANFRSSPWIMRWRLAIAFRNGEINSNRIWSRIWSHSPRNSHWWIMSKCTQCDDDDNDDFMSGWILYSRLMTPLWPEHLSFTTHKSYRLYTFASLRFLCSPFLSRWDSSLYTFTDLTLNISFSLEKHFYLIEFNSIESFRWVLDLWVRSLFVHFSTWVICR